jgi:hypothetical protein
MGRTRQPTYTLLVSLHQHILSYAADSHAKKNMLLRLYDRRQAMLSSCGLESMSVGKSSDIGQPHVSCKAC